MILTLPGAPSDGLESSGGILGRVRTYWGRFGHYVLALTGCLACARVGTINWTCRDCKKIIIGHKPEHCPECHETFGGTHTGDLHRAGQHGVTTGPTRRRCLTSAELEAKGLVQNSRGYWIRRAELPDSLRS